MILLQTIAYQSHTILPGPRYQQRSAFPGTVGHGKLLNDSVTADVTTRQEQGTELCHVAL